MTVQPNKPVLLLLACLGSAAQAQTVNQTPTSAPATADTETTRVDTGDFFTGFWRRSMLLGDMGGLRPFLGRAGITVALTETSEVLGNATGGLKQGATYDGLTNLTLQMDTQKAFGWEGGLLNVSALQIHGRNLSQYYLANLQTASGVEASPTTRFWEIWYQQSFLNNAFDVKIGQQSLDQEFIVSSGSSLFVNTMMGWPLVPSVDLYAGGPAYPLSSLGVRLRATTGPFTVLAGAFQDNPPGGPFNDDSQLRGSSRFGANFNLRTGALFIAEVQYAINQPVAGELDDGSAPKGLPGTYKLGGWYDTASFPSQSIDSSGLSLADPNTTGNPRMLRHNYSLYGVADQVIWRPDPDGQRALGVFVRAMGAPGDRNLVDFSLNAGFTLKAPIAGRDNDTLGIGYGLGKLSQSARQLDQATSTLGGSPTPVRGTEHFIELTYQAQVTPWLQLQPDFQYVFSPGGGILNPNNPTKKLRDEAIFGVRSTITF